MIDETGLYKRMCHRAEEIQNAWIPQAGDFWYCSCTSCLVSNQVWVIERPDVMAIDPKYSNEYLKVHYYRDVVSEVMTSRDCGFGAFWCNWKIEGERGHVWLPRFDQLINFASLKPELGATFTQRMGDFMDYVYGIHRSEGEAGRELTQSEQQLALMWIMERVFGKRYHENSDKPITEKEPVEPIEAPEVMTRDDEVDRLNDEMAALYKMMRSSKRQCGGAWFEIKTA